nr:hypothetical protein Iba_chr03fCG3080 [Ipomoea batatas]
MVPPVLSRFHSLAPKFQAALEILGKFLSPNPNCFPATSDSIHESEPLRIRPRLKQNFPTVSISKPEVLKHVPNFGVRDWGRKNLEMQRHMKCGNRSYLKDIQHQSPPLRLIRIPARRGFVMSSLTRMRMKYFHQPLNVSSSMNRYSPMKFPIIENALNIKLMEKLEKESVVGEVLGCHSHSRTPNRRHSVSHEGEFHDPFALTPDGLEEVTPSLSPIYSRPMLTPSLAAQRRIRENEEGMKKAVVRT